MPGRGKPDGIIVAFEPESEEATAEGAEARTPHFFLVYAKSDKARPSDRDVPRLIPVIPDVCDDLDVLVQVVRHGHVTRAAILSVQSLARDVGITVDALGQRHLISSLLLHYLLFDPRGRRLGAVAPRGTLCALNAAQGHGHRSHAWASYCHGFRAAATTPGA